MSIPNFYFTIVVFSFAGKTHFTLQKQVCEVLLENIPINYSQSLLPRKSYYSVNCSYCKRITTQRKSQNQLFRKLYQGRKFCRHYGLHLGANLLKQFCLTMSGYSSFNIYLVTLCITHLMVKISGENHYLSRKFSVR
jgi:hypothetical protein